MAASLDHRARCPRWRAHARVRSTAPCRPRRASCWRRPAAKSLVRLVITAGVDSGFAVGNAATDAMLDHLAEIGPTRQAPLAATLAGVRQGNAGGAVVVITTAGATDADLDAIARLRARFGAVYAVVYERSAVEPSSAWFSPTVRALPAGIIAVRVNDQRLFARSWGATVGPNAMSRSRS